MSEEKKESLQETKNEETQEQKTSPQEVMEKKAMEMGWRPFDEYEGDKDQWVSADAFVARTPLFEKISAQNKTIKQMASTMEEFKKHHEKVKESSYRKALKELRKERAEAITQGDAAALDDVEDRMKDLEQENKTREVEAQPSQGQPTQEFIDWKKENPWYMTDMELTEEADALGSSYAAQGLTPSQVFAKVSKTIRKINPDKFRNPKRDDPSGVTSGSTTKGPKSKLNSIEANMPDSDKQIMYKLVKNGVMTKEKYLEEYQSMSGE